ncbi:MAG: ATP-dependent helicase, partial [Actinobacteria bacterium]|nr:ATP-dependent helicase [Actinomycetota bacterium]MCG2802936.1 ATP-dependent helicase [Cellulomonas sp.]
MSAGPSSASPSSPPVPPHVSRAASLPPAYPARASWGTAQRLRAWQAQALVAYREKAARDFLAVATPGAGKTTFALRVAAELLEAGTVRRI